MTLLDGFLHNALFCHEDALRQGKLQVRFGILVGALAIVYSAFFFAIGHPWGGAVVATTGLAMLQIPWLIRRSGNLFLSGSLYGVSLFVGLCGLCLISGGLQGPFSAWFAALPLCALILMRVRIALIWSAISFAAVLGLAVLGMKGVAFPSLYESESALPILSVSYLGLVIFFAFVGLLLEQSRSEAFDRLQAANGKLESLNQELVDLNQQKNEFLNIAAHDLKNPLTIICSYADLLRELESPTLKQIRTQASEILRSGHHMLDIVSNILDVRMIEDGKKPLYRQRCTVEPILSHLVDDFQSHAESKEITLAIDLPDDTPDAWADPNAFRQILENLLSNALKYTKSGGAVRLEAFADDERCVIQVRDNGPGLSPEDQARLWKKFTRLAPRPTAGESSTGLGLWIVKRLTEQMGGKAFCDSRPGFGSTFGVRLPAWSGQAEEAPDFAVDGEADDDDGFAAFEQLIADIERQASDKLPKDRSEDSSPSDVILPG